MRWWRGIGRLFTSSGRGPIDHAAVVADGERITWVGAQADLPRPLRSAVTDEVDVGGALMTAGLIDAHTHPLYAGHRFDEIARRSAGATYAELAAAGGGILATVRATRAASRDELSFECADRLSRWLRAGTTTVEAKTGYHLSIEGELNAVALLEDLRGRADLPRLAVTYLAAHAVPPEAASADEWIDVVAASVGSARTTGATACDVFCDEGYFTVEQSRRLLGAARAAGLGVRLHADELARTGGAQLAAELGAQSADHLLRIDASDARALAAAGVVATLAPLTALAMGERPPVDLLRDAGATLALATDHNPGTCGSTEPALVIAIAIADLGLPVGEALTAATAGGARSLGRHDLGRVEPGCIADLVTWDADHEGAFAWAYGLHATRVWLGGHEVPQPRF